MEIRFVNFILSLCITALATYGIYLLNINEVGEIYKLICTTFAVQFGCTLTLIIGFCAKEKSLDATLNAICILFLVLFSIAAVVFARISEFSKGTFIFVEGILSVLFLLVLNSSIQKLKKK